MLDETPIAGHSSTPPEQRGILNRELIPWRTIVLYLPHHHVPATRQALTYPKSCPKTATYRCRRPLQLVALTWTLVSSDQVRPDGSKLKQFGVNPNGINVFDANGRFFLMMSSSDNSRIASNRSMTQSEEDGLIAESIAYYGTYTVNDEVNVISLHLDASTFPNQVGTDQKRNITSLTANELKYSSPAAKSGDLVHQVWKRAQ